MWSKYGKSIISALFFVWTVVAPLLTGDGAIHGVEWLIISTGAGNAILTYVIPLNPNWRGGKTVTLAVMASVAAAQTVVGDGLQPDDWTIIIGAGLTILIGWYAPAVTMPDTNVQVKVKPGLNA